MTDFWNKAEAKIKSNIPHFIRVALEKIHVSDGGTFSTLTDDEVEEVCNELTKTIKQIAAGEIDAKDNNGNDQKENVLNHCNELGGIERYTLPFGYRKKIKMLRNAFAAKRKSDVNEKPIDIENLKNWEIQLNTKVKTMIPEDKQHDVAEIKIDEDSLQAKCLFCLYKTSVIDKGILHGSNYYKHIKSHFPDLQPVNAPHTSTESSTLISQPSLPHNLVETPVLQSIEPTAKTQRTTRSKRAATTASTPPIRKSFRTSEQDSSDEEMLTPFLKICIENAKTNKYGNRNNRFASITYMLASYFYVRFGQSSYEMLANNLSFPSVKTIHSFMSKNLKTLVEGELYVEDLFNFLEQNNYPKEIALVEDGTKLTESVEYDASTNTIIGLVAPFNETTGLPIVNYFKASTAQKIITAFENYSKASYINVILAQANITGSPYFILAFYGTDNKFNSNMVSTRVKYITNILSNRGIRVICFGSGGDSRFLASQKSLMNFGIFSSFCEFPLAADLNSHNLANQDALHVCKKIQNRLFDMSQTLRIGKFHASLSHLQEVYKRYNKIEHNLILSDLDSTNKMNYQCLPKITSQNVRVLLQQIDGAEGTIAVLDIIKSIMIAFVEPQTSDECRIFHSVFSSHLIRIWRQYLFDNNLDAKTWFITSNAFESIEINLVLMMRLAKEQNLHNIFELCSQRCEALFRTIRSRTGMGSTMVNMNQKEFASRVHKLQFEEKAMSELKDIIIFPKILKREAIEKRQSQKLSILEIEKIVSQGKAKAEQRALELGMSNFNIQLSLFMKSMRGFDVGIASSLYVDEHLLEDEDNIDFFEVNNLVDRESEDDFTTFQNIEFSNQSSSTSFLDVLIDGISNNFSKQKLIKLLQNDRIKINTDIRQRFVARRTITLPKARPNENKVWYNNVISKGEYILIRDNHELLYGCVINISKYKERSKIQKVYYKDFVDISATDSNDLGILLFPVYIVQDFQKFDCPTRNNYICIKNYVCHISNDIKLEESDVKNLIVHFLNK
ncbi:hypothetical protein PVAND_006362 [Polypedilum vanderplanki]|uniref:Uncharacterized protein n=1 Tax=Polypedilum vanderplanki TaxID=319348 RepID=A0A9J6C3U5_POLVA|nr:hypothetical protein PVAND_006362 [Polypedilum vanderplanki]